MAAPVSASLLLLLRTKYVQCSRVSTTCWAGAGFRWRAEKGLSGNWNAPGNTITDSPDWSYADGRPGHLTHRQKERVLKQMEYAKTIVQMVKDVDFAVDYEMKQKQQQQLQKEEILVNKLKPKGTLWELEGNNSSKPRRRHKLR